MPVQETVKAFAFGPFVLNLQDRALYRMGLPVEIHDRVFEILRCLVTHSDRLVSKDVLVDEVWGGSAIGDNNIAQHMHLVREVLGDLSKPYRYVATVHGRGYRLIAQPHPVHDGHRTTHDGDGRQFADRVLAAELLSNAAFFMTMGTPAALESSAQLCRKALEIEPHLADAHAAIAMGAILKAAFSFGLPLQQFDVARRHAEEALRLDPRCARAHAAMGALSILSELAPEQAHQHLDVAAAALPDLPEIGIVRMLAFCAQGRMDRAREASIAATTLHASSTPTATYAAFVAYLAGDLESCVFALERLLVFKPGAAFATYLLGLAQLARGNYTAARERFEALLAARISLVPAYEKFRVRAIAALAFIEARTGALEDARALARDVQRSRYTSFVALALARAGAGEEDSVIACLQRARDQRDPWFAFVSVDPAFREYRELPEIREILNQPV